MQDALALAAGNLLSPMVLSFALGATAAALRSDLEIPAPMAKGLAVYLMFAIGLKGGGSMAGEDVGAAAAGLLVAAALSVAIPLVAFALLRTAAGLGRVDAAAVAAHYGSVSVVTFVAASEFLRAQDVAYEARLVAMLAIMETPAILVGLWLARSARPPAAGGMREILREVLFNGSIVLLLGGFAIGWASGPEGLAKVRPYFVDLFNGVLCLFLLDMGLVAVRQLRSGGRLGWRALAFGLYMPPIGAALGLAGGLLLDLSPGGCALLATLAASASYIAVPAAMRLALPEARPSLYVTLSLAVTFPFNVVLGVPLYYAAARWAAG